MIEYVDGGRKISPVLSDGGIEIYRLEGAGTYKWTEELKGVFYTWAPLGGRDHSIRQWFFPNSCEAMYQFGAPLMATVDADENNRVTAALSDSVSRSKISVCVDDLNQKDEIIFTVNIENSSRLRRGGEVLLRIDRREILYCRAISDAGEWMRSFLPGGQVRVPDNAELPLYSSWYNFHQEPDGALLEKELELAAKMGFKTFILDDGWQFEGENTGDYYKCGDWSVARDKFPDFRRFCDRVHGFGIRMLMWFPVPFAGYATEDYRRLKDKMAYNNDAFRAGVLDIRYPEIRAYISGIYERFVREYGIDGLKLDFIDAFRADPSIIAPFAEGMDTESLDDAAVILMDEIYAKLTAIDPDFLFEFRQCYIGAAIVNRCNMLRVADCAADSSTNRVGIAALRMVNGGTAIHSDMLLWGRRESPLNCARQLMNIMFSVPQISVRLTGIGSDQLAVLSHFVRYWTENRAVLLHGVFSALHPDFGYSVMRSETADKRISVLSAEPLFAPCGKPEDVFNNTSFDYVVSAGGACFGYEVFDMVGNLLSSGVSGPAAEKLAVPRGGMLRVKGS
ncbi:MAG: alpha-galactosidase [Clostridia bacterium]|nr:alpha-galactosidase [Clostridia bacterium]